MGQSHLGTIHSATFCCGVGCFSCSRRAPVFLDRGLSAAVDAKKRVIYPNRAMRDAASPMCWRIASMQGENLPEKPANKPGSDPGFPPVDYPARRDADLDRLADAVEAALDWGRLAGVLPGEGVEG